ncbi:Cell cycle serine/threonine-protein kinase cdc5/MSD2 [Vermiconidia calcicola]|uniref:Cell cycle serine/threonine-protein kinase cdc5/MSD2 n=1 Tax=Vermiconidia calcicola TaxID=1690605 RepID=A0ACC3NLH9_9PEZI|nr:Cell cycle serine/threonine-protein kinase cdc5/MSD2 [Vermiconidia calcicola]
MSSVHADPPPPIVTEPSGINYATGSALGKGGFAICHRAERYDGSRPTGQLVALKIVKTKMEPAKLGQKFVTELQIHSKLSHPNIVAFYRAFSFQTSTYVVLELCSNGSLADMLKKRKYLTLPEIRRFVVQICGAVKYLHHRHIVHRDLKTGNLFLDENMNVKVGDFGLAALLVTEKEMEVKRRTTMCGTPNYLAPEILEKGKGHDEKVDLWAIGVIAYTLAVGKAPFHASTKEEIYKKLKSGTYTWPELSATTNQSSDLRNLVSSLLVPEEQRPIPDQIVSQNFFKIAFVPSSIPSAAREKAPKWPEVSIPSAEVVRRGYSDTWFAICKESGVGEYEEGKHFKLNYGKRVKSVVYDIAQEAQLGRQPTMPIPKDVVYTSTVTDWNAPSSNGPSVVEVPSGEEKRPASRGLKEISHNEVSNPRQTATERATAARDAELMPPPPTRGARTGTVRKAARTISEEAAKAAGLPVRIPSDEAVQTLRLPKVRQAAGGPIAACTPKDPLASSSFAYQTARSQQATEANQSEKPTARTGTAKRSADASLARRPRATKAKERPRSPGVPGPLATLDELQQVSPLKKSRRKLPEPEVVEILSDPEPELEPERKNPADAILSLPPPPQMSKRLPVPRKPSAGCKDPNVVSGSDPTAVLERLSTFRNNLASAMSNSSQTRTSSADADNLPFVFKWVDYSRKYGVGYILSDGTVGCIINASSKNPARNTTVAHVLVRNGQKWLSRIGKNFENIESVPLEVFEDCGAEGIKRKVYKGLGSVKEGPLKDEAERRRTLSVLWAKFGRYMCESVEGEQTWSAVQNENFVRFYQRVGSVGIWAFVDGCLQVHFPDHTKLVLSATGTHVSATCISSEAASYLSSNSDLLPHHVSSREVFSDSIISLLHEGGRVRARIVKANALAEKLTFVLSTVDQWIRNGGIGRLDEDGGGKGERLYWEGLMVKDGARKMDRITVGRCGGDLAS